MFITFNTTKQAYQFIKNRYKEELPVIYDQYAGDNPIYRIDIDDKKRIIEITGWSCACGCGKGHASAKVIGKIKQVKS